MCFGIEASLSEKLIQTENNKRESQRNIYSFIVVVVLFCSTVTFLLSLEFSIFVQKFLHRRICCIVYNYISCFVNFVCDEIRGFFGFHYSDNMEKELDSKHKVQHDLSCDGRAEIHKHKLNELDSKHKAQHDLSRDGKVQHDLSRDGKGEVHKHKPKDLDLKHKVQHDLSQDGKVEVNKHKPKAFKFRAPQEHFTIQDFELGKIYGVGSYSKVVRAKKKDTGVVYALKIMDKKFITKENKTAYVKLERIVLDQLDHPGIVRLFFTFQDSCSLYMGLESCEGGELFDQITRKGRLSEDEARFYTAEVIDALEYIHKLGLIHRDIKPENLLLTKDGHIKIADFGSVKPMHDSLITLLPNAASDDKACTFVGTAAYVPPEVLNSSPATVGNDLWAIGCTLYQMLSGTSPFKDASEWLIFQRIIARDVRFPNYFSYEARDLIDRLLDIDPSRRPGAGPDGYAFLKKHHFFNGVNWNNLQSQTPPKLAFDPKAKSDDVHDAGEGNENASFSKTRLASIESFDSKWQQFLEPGESVIMISMVKRLQKITNKKVQLILTNKPKLVYVDPSKLMVKGNIIWSDNPNELNVQVLTPTNFKICTPRKVMAFEDAKQRGHHWKKAIEELQNRE